MLLSRLSSPPSPSKALHRCAFVAAALAVVAASGCWEEIRYQGPAPAAEAPRSDPRVAPAAESDIETPPSATPAEIDEVPADEVSADELFGEAPTPQDDAPVEPAAAGDAASATPPEGELSSDAVIDAEPAATAEGVAAPATPPAGRAPITSAQRLDAWTVASAWSLAAAVAAKGFDSEKYEPFLAEARRAADALDVALPPLPASGDDPQQRVAATIDALRNGSGPQLVEELILRLDPAAGIAARLAIDSHLLLLWYTPRAADAISATVSIQAAGEASELPVELWQPLVELLQRRADFVEVRAAVFALHQAVTEHLAGE